MRIIVKVRSEQQPDALTVKRASIKIASRPLRVLDFDIENRPITYLGSDFTTGQVTAVAWAWTDEPDDIAVHLLENREGSEEEILRRFVGVYNQADVVTGHFILGHDLPFLNGALMDRGMQALSDKLVQDTKMHLTRAKGISRSQESLAAMFGIDAPKVQMNQAKWREANKLTKKGLAYVRERVAGDVRQHMKFRRYLLEHGYLGPPKIWRSYSREPLATYSA